MKFWIDTEFYEDGKIIELISIGVVAEDERLYYAETLSSKYLAGRNYFLEQNVKPQLGKTSGVRTNREIAQDLIKFCGESPEFWGYYADYDWVVICQLFGTMMALPKSWPMFCMDVKQWAVMLGNPELPKQKSGEHHALSDALWTRTAWEFLEKKQREIISSWRIY